MWPHKAFLGSWGCPTIWQPRLAATPGSLDEWSMGTWSVCTTNLPISAMCQVGSLESKPRKVFPWTGGTVAFPDLQHVHATWFVLARRIGPSFWSTTLRHPYCTSRPNFESSTIYQFPGILSGWLGTHLNWSLRTVPSQLKFTPHHPTRRRGPWNLLRSYFHGMCHRKERYSWHLRRLGQSCEWRKDANLWWSKTLGHLVLFQSLPRGPEAKANCSDSTAGFFLSWRRTGQTQSSSIGLLKNSEMALSPKRPWPIQLLACSHILRSV